MEEAKNTVQVFGSDGGGTIKFSSKDDYTRFQTTLNMFAPKIDPFDAFGNTSFIARKGTQRRRMTTMLSKVDSTLDEMTSLDFEVLVVKKEFFKGWVWKPH